MTGNTDKPIEEDIVDNNLGPLNPDAYHHILSFLNPRELLKFGLVSKTFHALSNDPELWKKLWSKLTKFSDPTLAPSADHKLALKTYYTHMKSSFFNLQSNFLDTLSTYDVRRLDFTHKAVFQAFILLYRVGFSELNKPLLNYLNDTVLKQTITSDPRENQAMFLSFFDEAFLKSAEVFYRIMAQKDELLENEDIAYLKTMFNQLNNVYSETAIVKNVDVQYRNIFNFNYVMGRLLNVDLMNKQRFLYDYFLKKSIYLKKK